MATIAVYTNFGGHIVKENRGGTKRGYVPDPLGSTIALVDSAGAVTDTWEYAAYGEVESHTGPSTTPFTFVGTLGYFRDLVSSLTYVRARFYQGAIGQWMTMDPLWPMQPTYAYAGTNPVNMVDPSGAWNLACIGCAVCLGAALLAALLGCLGAREGMLECIKRWLHDNPWAWAIILGCLVLCAVCLGPALTRLLKQLIKPKPKPLPRPDTLGCYAVCMSAWIALKCTIGSPDFVQCSFEGNAWCRRRCSRCPQPGGGVPVDNGRDVIQEFLRDVA